MKSGMLRGQNCSIIYIHDGIRKNELDSLFDFLNSEGFIRISLYSRCFIDFSENGETMSGTKIVNDLLRAVHE